MSDTTFFLPVFLFFATAVCALGWQVIIKGNGTVDNLWVFGLLTGTVFILTTIIVSYFPFSNLTFFISILTFMNFSTLYIYSFPRSIWPNIVWLIFILIANLIPLIAFAIIPEKSFAPYFSASILFSSVNIPIIIRKIKYLESKKIKAVMIHLTFIAVLSFFFPFLAGISALTFHPKFFIVLLFITIPLSLIFFGLVSYFNINTGAGINKINFPLIIVLSIPTTFLIKNLFSFRAAMLNYISSTHFTFGVLFILFILTNTAGILISVFSSTIEGFINRSRHYYQKYINQYKVEIEKTTDSKELFLLFNNNILSWFNEIKSIKYLFFTEEFSSEKNLTFNIDPLEYQISTSDTKFLHEPYFVRNSVDFPIEMINLSDKYSGNVFIPVIYKNELNGFIILETRKFSHSALSCINNILEITINRYEKLFLFMTVLETEKKIELLKHFQETGKMVSVIAHELRSPLSSVMFNMEVIKDSLEREKKPDPEYLDISLKEIRRLNETVEKMLTYGRNIKLIPVLGDFYSFFDEIKKLFSSTGETIKFVENTNGENFYFDWDMLKNVLINLINNSIQSIKLSGNQGVVIIKSFRKRNKVIVEVKDNGTGIPQEHINSIFEPFFTTRKEGNGLGLAISEKIVKLSGGTILLKETSGKGTIFHITLPAEQQQNNPL